MTYCSTDRSKGFEATIVTIRCAKRSLDTNVVVDVVVEVVVVFSVVFKFCAVQIRQKFTRVRAKHVFPSCKVRKAALHSNVLRNDHYKYCLTDRVTGEVVSINRFYVHSN